MIKYEYNNKCNQAKLKGVLKCISVDNAITFLKKEKAKL